VENFDGENIVNILHHTVYKYSTFVEYPAFYTLMCKYYAYLST